MWDKLVAVFKHSTRCSISSAALNRMEQKWTYDDQDVIAFYLDLISHREVSNEIAQRYQVYHESPQLLLIKDGKCVYDSSHMAIQPSEIANFLN